MSNLYENLTEDKLWNNFESDFFRCRKPDLFNRFIELDSDPGRIFRDYVVISHAIELTDYFWDESNCFNEKLLNGMIFIEAENIKKELDKMLKRKKINPKQKQLAGKFLRKLNATFTLLSEI